MLNAPVPKEPVSLEVVAVSPSMVELVPQAKPLTVALEPPVTVMFPLKTAVVVETDEAD